MTLLFIKYVKQFKMAVLRELEHSALYLYWNINYIFRFWIQIDFIVINFLHPSTSQFWMYALVFDKIVAYTVQTISKVSDNRYDLGTKVQGQII